MDSPARSPNSVSLTIPVATAKTALLLGLDALLAATLALPGVWSDPGTRIATLAALLGLLGWQAALWRSYAAGRRPFVALEPHFRKIYFLQFCFQNLVALYWGVYFRDVYAHYSEVAVQLAFGMALELTLAWTLRRAWFAGISVFPIVMSVNLFLWFQHEAFCVQLALIAGGVLSKTFITWERGGKRRHIFNPSALPLAIAAVAVLATGRTDLGRGADFPSSYALGPNIFEVIFLVGLLVNTLFPTVLMTASAAMTLAFIDLAVMQATGKSFLTGPLLDSTVFLGATLLFTDPATTPPSRVGKVLTGVAYAAFVTVIVLFLHAMKQPGYYDKVLAVPPVNLLVPAIERVSGRIERFVVAWPEWVLRLLRPRLVHLAVWSVFFALYLPALKGHAPRPAWLPPPDRDRPSDAMKAHMLSTAMICTTWPKVCAPFGLREELYAWLYNPRFRSLVLNSRQDAKL